MLPKGSSNLATINKIIASWSRRGTWTSSAAGTSGRPSVVTPRRSRSGPFSDDGRDPAPAGDRLRARTRAERPVAGGCVAGRRADHRAGRLGRVAADGDGTGWRPVASGGVGSRARGPRRGAAHPRAHRPRRPAARRGRSTVSTPRTWWRCGSSGRGRGTRPGWPSAAASRWRASTVFILFVLANDHAVQRIFIDPADDRAQLVRGWQGVREEHLHRPRRRGDRAGLGSRACPGAARAGNGRAGDLDAGHLLHRRVPCRARDHRDLPGRIRPPAGRRTVPQLAEPDLGRDPGAVADLRRLRRGGLPRRHLPACTGARPRPPARSACPTAAPCATWSCRRRYGG